MGRIPWDHLQGAGDGRIDKTASTHPEQTIPRSPAKAFERQPATASYNNVTGRAARVADDEYTRRDNAYGHRGARHDGPDAWKQIPSERSTDQTEPLKPRTRPGRW